MSLPRQVVGFLLVGGIQVALDWAVFVAATALGMPAAPANVVGRVSGALLGFWLNGRYTFQASGGSRLAGAALRRFCVTWVLLTALGTLLVAGAASHLGLGYAWLAKPLVEAGLAVLSFFISRHWIYR